MARAATVPTAWLGPAPPAMAETAATAGRTATAVLGGTAATAMLGTRPLPAKAVTVATAVLVARAARGQAMVARVATPGPA
ncbi:hypothetical protein PJM56_29445, partial [Mycobacterium kansasii]